LEHTENGFGLKKRYIEAGRAALLRAEIHFDLAEEVVSSLKFSKINKYFQ